MNGAMQSLNGMKVLDLTQHLSGPYCTMVLGDLGADVLKIEKLQGDDQRKLGPFVGGESAPFMAINRNKKSITLDLKAPQGRDILLGLARQCDVIIENFRPGIVASLGIDHASVKALNPGIVYCSISGYGQTGPYSRKGGFDIIAQGMTGLLEINTEAGRRPTKIPISLHDIGAGITAVYTILAACIHKVKTGEGQYVDVSLVESGLALTMIEAASYFVSGKVAKVAGTRNHLAAPYQAYRTRDGYVIVGASHDKMWHTFCRQVVERPEWIDDPRFVSVGERLRHADALEQLIEEVLVQHDTSHWVEKMDAAGIPGGPINTHDQALANPHLLAREMVVEIDHPKAGRVKSLGFPAKLSRTPGQIRRPAPTLGQHTDEVLHELLGLGSAEIAALRARQVI
jgi:crotonobetainyl-CoA:carnitine CoA-transferase CaiB-like acyl-CoA transferase